MDTLLHADIFFLITSIAVVFISVFMVVALYYFILPLRRLNKLIEKLEVNIQNAGEEVEEMVGQVRESFIFNLLFPRKKKRTK
ncbi:MAG: hypothetical protein KA515_02495 [Candidatus Pacebacteria bacterium]|nr:hypothetical protein [Candidatus Paceibacterota bacterium]